MDFEQFRFKSGSSLGDFRTAVEDDFEGYNERRLKKRRVDLWDELAQLQERLYAESKQSLLIVLQAMDAAGKDSSIDKLTRQLNAQGCHVHSFKSPTKQELAHDFLWRVHDKVSAKGEMTIFNRSHYEDVLIVKVHGWADDEQIQARYQHINNFESLLADRGTRVLKFMLNISPEYQLERFKRRLDNADKNWKFNPGDLDERQLWPQYMAAFHTALSKSSTDQAPWYVVPAENRLYRDVLIANVIVETLKNMNPKYPDPDFDPAEFNSKSIS